MYSLQWVACSVRCEAFSKQCAVGSVQWAVCSKQCAVRSMPLTSSARPIPVALTWGRTLQADGCEHDIWEVELLLMTRLNRHHYCIGGCKTHTRRSYQMHYRVDRVGGGAVMNMSNMQTGRHIPFETVRQFPLHARLDAMPLSSLSLLMMPWWSSRGQAG